MCNSDNNKRQLFEMGKQTDIKLYLVVIVLSIRLNKINLKR